MQSMNRACARKRKIALPSDRVALVKDDFDGTVAKALGAGVQSWIFREPCHAASQGVPNMCFDVLYYNIASPGEFSDLEVS